MSYACSRMHALLLMRAHFHIHLRLLQVRLQPYAVVIYARVCVHLPHALSITLIACWHCM